MSSVLSSSLLPPSASLPLSPSLLHVLVYIVYTVIWFYFVLYLISYAAVRTKIKRTNIIQQRNLTKLWYMYMYMYNYIP